MIKHLRILFLCALPILLHAQDDALYTLSPFEVSPEPGSYKARNFPATPTAPITLKMRAENVAFQIILTNNNRKAELRNQELHTTISKLEAKAETIPGIRVNSSQMSLSAANSKYSLFSSSDVDSKATILIVAKLDAEDNVFDKVQSIKDFIADIDVEGDTKAIAGSIGLGISNPERFRAELIRNIADDLHLIRDALGDDIGIDLYGIDKKLQIYQCSDSEVELYLPYSFSITYNAQSPNHESE